MKRKETCKFIVITKQDRELDITSSKVRVKGDYFEATTFAVEAIVRAYIDMGMSKKDFLKLAGDIYTGVKECEK